MRRLTLLAALALAAPLPALGAPDAAAERAAQNAVDTALGAMSRGHGAMCSLRNEPVPSGGYYPCLDIGPYRFVREYGRVRAFVLLKDQAPYPILVSTNGETEFTVSGEWTRDLAPRVALWWDDEVMGAKGRRDSAAEGDGRRRDADAAVRGFGGKPETQAPAAEAPAAQPEAALPVQAQPAEPGDLRSRPIPSRAPPGGVDLAPGVVGYPNGLPGPGRR